VQCVPSRAAAPDSAATTSGRCVVAYGTGKAAGGAKGFGVTAKAPSVSKSGVAQTCACGSNEVYRVRSAMQSSILRAVDSSSMLLASARVPCMQLCACARRFPTWVRHGICMAAGCRPEHVEHLGGCRLTAHGQTAATNIHARVGITCMRRPHTEHSLHAPTSRWPTFWHLHDCTHRQASFQLALSCLPPAGGRLPPAQGPCTHVVDCHPRG
jgi:hypothetical protein